MMAFIAPAPRTLRVRLSEECKKIQIRIARWPLTLLEFAQHVFELADGFRLRIALLAQTGVQQCQRRSLLRRVHLLQRNSFSRNWRIEPAKTLLGVERQHCL